MILLECNNRIIKEYIEQKVQTGSRNVDEYVFADFDGVQFRISVPNPDSKAIVNFSMRWSCFKQLQAFGVQDDLKKMYGPMLSAPEKDYDVTVTLDFDNLIEAGDQLAMKLSNLKRHVFAAPFKSTFQSIIEKKSENTITKISYREGEAFYLKPEGGDRCIVIFEIAFKDPDDGTLSKIFLQEFADARRSMRNVPSVNFNIREPPLELEGYELQDVKNNGFVSFVLFENHMVARNVVKTINLLQTFRDYLHYHIKCSKAYMHNRMRARVALLLQILNRARPEPFVAKQKKKMSGRTFVRK